MTGVVSECYKPMVIITEIKERNLWRKYLFQKSIFAVYNALKIIFVFIVDRISFKVRIKIQDNKFRMQLFYCKFFFKLKGFLN